MGNMSICKQKVFCPYSSERFEEINFPRTPIIGMKSTRHSQLILSNSHVGKKMSFQT